MESKIYSIVILSFLVCALITAIPTTSVNAIPHEGLMGEDQGGNMTQDRGEEKGGITEGQTDPDGEGEVDLGTGGP